MDYEINFDDLANKLFCTFTTKDALDSTVDTIKGQYQILFNKIFVLYVDSTSEYVCTYNVDSFNMSDKILDNTILLHRKKESNTLYTINALNDLIRSLNSGNLDTSFKVNWQDYKNCILLTTGGELKKLDTKIHEIINF
tara:strand:- start:663 stop:1079 length:417 start_codon:yes stop_codon:yes gene_type:complete